MNNIGGIVVLYFMRGGHPFRWRHLKHHLELWIYRLVTGTRFDHVAISDGEIVLDQTLAGPIVFTRDEFECVPRGVRVVCVISTDRVAELESVWKPGRVGVFRAALRWLTRGRFRSNDCVEVATRYLQVGGIMVDRWIGTPGDLYRWIQWKLHMTGMERVDCSMQILRFTHTNSCECWSNIPE